MEHEMSYRQYLALVLGQRQRMRKPIFPAVSYKVQRRVEARFKRESARIKSEYQWAAVNYAANYGINYGE